MNEYREPCEGEAGSKTTELDSRSCIIVATNAQSFWPRIHPAVGVGRFGRQHED